MDFRIRTCNKVIINHVPESVRNTLFGNRLKIKPIQANIKVNENKKAEESYKIVISIRQKEFCRVELSNNI